MASTGTGVVIGSHSLKVVQARRKGGILRLTRVVHLKLDPKEAGRPFDARKREYLATLLRNAGVRPDEAVVGLTGRDLIIRYTHVPPVPDWRLDMLMKFEIDEVSEQSGGEVSADYRRLDLAESVSADHTVLVALAKNASLLPRIEVLRGAGLRLMGACPNSIGMFHAFVTTAKIRSGEVTLLMHIGAENTDIAIQKDGRLLFARNVSGGGRLFTEAIMNQFRVDYSRAEKMKAQKTNVAPRARARYADSLEEKLANAAMGVTGQFVSMVHSSVMFAKAQTKIQDLSVDRVVLTGGGANLRGLPEYLESNLGIPVELYDPSGAVDASGLPPDQKEVFEYDPKAMTVAVGLASLGMDRDAFRLLVLPEEYRRKRRFRERDVWMIGAGAVTAALIAVLFYVSSRDHGDAMRYSLRLSRIDREQKGRIAELAEAREGYRAALRKWVALRDAVRTGPALHRALALVGGVIRDRGFNEIHITSVRTGTEALTERPKDGGRLDEPPPKPGEGPPLTILSRVDFIAQLQRLGRAPSAVYTDFISELRTAVRALPGVRLEEQALQQTSNTFRFSIFLAPREERPAEQE